MVGVRQRSGSWVIGNGIADVAVRGRLDSKPPIPCDKHVGPFRAWTVSHCAVTSAYIFD